MTGHETPKQASPSATHWFAASRSATRVAMSLLLAASLPLVGCATTPPPEPAAPPPSAAPAAPPGVMQTVVTRVDAKASPEVFASLPELPRPSPNALVEQDVGITKFRVTYSSPGVKGRVIWGDLVPYGELWRAGANAPTKLIADRDFTFAGVAVPAGSYSLMTIPKQGTWTVILNQDPKNQGTVARDPALDVAVVELAPVQAPPRERLAFEFYDTTDEQTQLVLDWAGLRLAMPIAVDTKQHVAASVEATLENAWRPLFNAGRHAFTSGDDARAVQLLQQSLQVRETWWSHWWLAQTFAKQNQLQLARQHAERALALGEGDDVFQRAFAADVKKALEGWPAS